MDGVTLDVNGPNCKSGDVFVMTLDKSENPGILSYCINGGKHEIICDSIDVDIPHRMAMLMMTCDVVLIEKHPEWDPSIVAAQKRVSCS